jgi:transcriptional regulator with XRE-family HTH domain
MTKMDIGKTARDLRAAAGVTQAALAALTGVSGPAISVIENGASGVSVENAKAYVDLIAATPPDQLKTLAKAALQKQETEKVESIKKVVGSSALPAFSRELNAFRARHHMTHRELGELLNVSDSTLHRWRKGGVPYTETVADIRQAMERYDGKKIKVDQPVTDKPTAIPPVPQNSVTNSPTVLVSRSTAAVPVAPVATKGVFLANGANIAPHLVLDGRTMHVFTLVPGGVFVSHLSVKE